MAGDAPRDRYKRKIRYSISDLITIQVLNSCFGKSMAMPGPFSKTFQFFKLSKLSRSIFENWLKFDFADYAPSFQIKIFILSQG